MKKANIKRFLALYFETSMNGGQFYEADDDEDSED